MRRSNVFRLIGALLLFTALAIFPAAANQLGPQTHYSSSDIQAAVQNTSGYNSTIMGNAGNLGAFESGGNAGINNGTCCTGVFQMNTSNLAAIGLTPTQYANMGLQQQAQAWVDLTNQASNTPAVRQLQTMAQNGQSFDGRPVDSSLILACIQLGTGNCQKMINSGSCSGFADSNGTTICKMADKINGGQSGNPSPGQNPQQNPANNASNSDNVGLQKDATNDCWACDAIIVAFNMQDKLATQFANNGGGTSWTPTKLLPFFTAIFAIVFVFQLGRNVVFWYMHYSPPREILGMFLRFVVVVFVLQTTFTTTIVQPYLIEPSIGIGGQLGARIGYIAAQSFGANLAPSDANCTTKAQLSMTDSVMTAGVQSIVNLVCGVHQQAYALIANPSKVMQCPSSSNSNTPLNSIATIVMKIYALAVAFMIAIGLITMALQIVEIAVRIGVYTILFPFFLYTWVYKKTSAIFHMMLKGYLYIFFKFAFLGPFLGAAVALFAIAATYAGGVSTNCSTDPSTNSAAFAALITSVLATIAVSAFANRLMTAASSVAHQITGYAYSNLGVAAAGAQAVALGMAGGMQNTKFVAQGLNSAIQGGLNAKSLGPLGAVFSSPTGRHIAALLGMGAIGAGAVAATGGGNNAEPASPLPANQIPASPEDQVQRHTQ